MIEKKTDTIIRVVIGVIIIIILTIIAVRKPYDLTPPPIHNGCNEDSLHNVINQLQSELQMSEDGWDRKENRYEDILFEYEYGINHLKESHPEAYKEFHRIIGYRERYSTQVERENKIRLKSNKF